MPFKARQFYSPRRKAYKVRPKRKWPDYNKKMKMLGDITIWLSPDLIPARNNATDEKHHHWMRNRNLREIKCYGRMKWQTDREYVKRNQAERAIGWCKRILGNRLHSRDFI